MKQKEENKREERNKEKNKIKNTSSINFHVFVQFSLFICLLYFPGKNVNLKKNFV